MEKYVSNSDCSMGIFKNSPKFKICGKWRRQRLYALCTFYN